MSYIFRENVLDNGFVELIDTMPAEDLDRAVVTAARVSYMSESKGESKDKKLLYYLIDNGHWSPFEQVEFKFRIKAPVICWWQWVRHRTWSYNMQSGRYTEIDEMYIPAPDQWRYQDSKDKQASSDEEMDPQTGADMTKYLQLTAERGIGFYKAALELGISREQARLFLPAWCLYYTGYAKTDARNLVHFLQLRDSEHAQTEIRAYSQVIKDMLSKVMPWTYEKVFGGRSK